ncbi:MAG: LamG domain-containing protein, partial [Euryarchaeota archaeon]|nr:LamG domain-containing protein [Euryarchaeota archaeon]
MVEFNNITLTKGKYIYNIGRKNSYYLKTCEYQVGGGVTFSERVEYIGKETLFNYPEADYGFDQTCPGSITVPKGKRYATRTKLIRETNPWPLTPEVTVIKNSLIGYWNFDEGSGEIAHDLSGYNNNGTIYGALWVDGKSGKALSFDGINNYVEIPDSPDLQFSDVFSVDLWILMNNLPAKEVPILFKGSDNIHRNYNYRINADIDGRLVLGVCSPTKEYYWYSKAKIKTGKWMHFVLTSDGSVIKFFVDGNFDSELKTIAPYEVYYGYPIRINWNEKPFNGIIDEVRIYNYALTEVEIKAAAN